MERYLGHTEIDFHFQYPSPEDPMLIELKRIAGIELDSTKSELANIQDIIGYAHGLFTHDGDNNPSSSDPLTILQEAQAGQSFRCVEYSMLANGLLWANNIPSRTLGLKTRDVETRQYGAGHVVIEFWSKDLHKWVMSDVQTGIIPETKGTPLSAVELRQKLDEKKIVTYIPVTGARFSIDGGFDGKKNYSEWVHEYLYFIDTPIQLALTVNNAATQQIAMLVPDGVQEPRQFQGLFMMNALYTHNVSDFYPKM